MTLVFTLDSFTSTQGQWWSCFTTKGTERRVRLEASCMGFHLWTADFRDARSGERLDQKVFCTKPGSSELVALFDNGDQRQRWMEDQWQKRAA
jgi:hypothetical protein